MTRKLGRTDLSVSVLGLGGTSFGPLTFWQPARARALVRTALDLGINWFDTAPFYRLTKAESRLGRALRGIRRDRYVLATKVGRLGFDSFDFSEAGVARSLDASLRRLGVDYVDLIQVHDVEFADLQIVIEEALPALRRAVDRGKARYVGITGYPLRALASVARSAPVDTILSYAHYHLQNRTLGAYLDGWGDRGIGVINASIFLAGLLTSRADRSTRDNLPLPIREACLAAGGICREAGVPIEQVALQFVLREGRIGSHLLATTSVSHLRQWASWSEMPMDLSLLSQVEACLAPVLDRAWPWGRPENQDSQVS
jgi:L-galactose dehydrogenase